jgi:hypothetical protein
LHKKSLHKTKKRKHMHWLYAIVSYLPRSFDVLFKPLEN